MTRPPNEKTRQRSVMSLRKRILRFDTLEERRLLAGVDIFLFDDVDASRSYVSSLDTPIAERAVYVDLDRDGRLSAHEPWAVTTENGRARFSGLAPGEYVVRLLGTNKTLVQTFPTQPADRGNWGSSTTLGSILQVEPDGTVWGISGNAIKRIDVALNLQLEAITFANSIQTAVVTQSENGSPISGVVLTHDVNGVARVSKFSASDPVSDSANSMEVESSAQLMAVGQRVLLVQSPMSGAANAKQVYELVQNSDQNDSLGLSLLPINAPLFGLTAELKSIGSHRFASLEQVDGLTLLSTYQLGLNGAEWIGSRSFVSPVSAWEASAKGNSIAVSTASDVYVLDVGPALNSKAILPGAVGPIVFDEARNLIYTGNSQDPARLTVWDASSGTVSARLAIESNGVESEPFTSIALDRFGKHLVGTTGDASYLRDVAATSAVVVTVAAAGNAIALFGTRSTGNNQSPVLGEIGALTALEDKVSSVGRRIYSSGSDADGDSLVFLVTNGPTRGQLSLNQNGDGNFLSMPDLYGQDFAMIQAFDGRDWSAPQRFSIDILPTNDVPSDIALAFDSIPENPRLGEQFGSIQAIDPDLDSDYQFRVDDPRFSVVDGKLQFVRGVVNFEREPAIVLSITASNRRVAGDVLTRTITLSVTDRNDAPTGIALPRNLVIPELTKGFVLGTVSAIDQDAYEQYRWTVNDARFQIVNGELGLVRDQELDFESGATVTLVIRGVDLKGEFAVEQTVSISVSDQDDEPTGFILSGFTNIPENRKGAVIGTVMVNDPDAGEGYSFQLSDSRFQVLRGVISLRPGVSLGFGETGEVGLTIIATSHRTGARVQQTLGITIQRDDRPYHNDEDPLDVDGDGALTPLDPLIIINYINNRGIGPLPRSGEGEGDPSIPNIDVDGDGRVSPIDILILINRLNEQEQEDEEELDEELSEDDVLPPVVSQSPRSGISPEGEGLGATVIDLSLAGYLNDLDYDVGTGRLRRR